MAATTATTLQSNIKNFTDEDMKDYALFLGGTNVTNEVLRHYDPLKTGYGRLFMVRKPVWVAKYAKTELNMFKHILEYGNTSVTGLQDIAVNFNSITGGYVGKSFEIPSYATDDTTEFTVQVYEFSGSPIRNLLHTWINGTTDLLTGLATYNGVNDIKRIQANQTAEFIYVSTDNTGEQIEYACLLANCFPKNISLDNFNYNSGEHNLVELSINFTTTKYESIQINAVAKALLEKYKVLGNSLNFYSGYDPKKDNLGGYTNSRGYDVTTGKLKNNVKTNMTSVSDKLDNSGIAAIKYSSTTDNSAEYL